MAIVRWEPFRELLTTQDRLNQLFNQTFGQAFGSEGQELGNRAWAPAVDIYETEQNLVIKAELPGIDPKDVEVRVENQTLFIRGERKSEKDLKEGSYHRVERTYGAFSRSFTLPATVNTENVTAEYKDGVLTLKLAKREEAKPKTIKIQVSEGKAQAATAGSSK
ncbi:MAG TPA: Hsp20/alpha crystallin family protein [Terriglobia bacterium]